MAYLQICFIYGLVPFANPQGSGASTIKN